MNYTDAQEKAHLEDLLQMYRGNLHHLEKQAASYGGIEYAPLSTINTLNATRQQIAETELRLNSLNNQKSNAIIDEEKQYSPPQPTRPPELVYFVGRDIELQTFTTQLNETRVVVISGMPGIGKTVLASALARNTTHIDHIFWHTFHKDEGINIFIWKLAAFLAYHGQADVWHLLQNNRRSAEAAPPPEILCDYLLQLACGRGYILCFDDFEYIENNAIITRFIEQLQEESRKGTISLSIVSRRIPPFALTTTITPLSGLTLPATQSLLDKRKLQLSHELLVDLHTLTGGNAQLLTMAIDILQRTNNHSIQISKLMEADDIERYLLAEVDTGLTDQERLVMSGIAIFMDYGCTRDAIEAILECGNIRRILLNLSNRHLLHVNEEDGERIYKQNTMIQAFYYDAFERRERQSLHHKAGAYYETEQKDLLKAAHHFFSAGEYVHAVHLATTDVWQFINRGQADILSHLLARLAAWNLDDEQRIALDIAQGTVYIVLGENVLAQKKYEDTLKRLGVQPDTDSVREQQARAYRGIGETLEHSAPQVAIEWLNRGLKIIEGRNTQETAALYIKIGNCQIALGDYTAAQNTIEQGLNLLPSGLSLLRASAQINLGIIFCANGDVKRGNEATKIGLDICQQLQDYVRMINALDNLGIEKYIAGEWEGAIADCQEALQLAEKIGNKIQIARLKLNLGIMYMKRGSYDTALEHLQQGLYLSRIHSLKEHMMYIQVSLADLYIRQKQLDLAIVALDDSENIAKELEIKAQLPEMYRLRGLIALMRDETAEAHTFIEQSIRISNELDSKLDEGVGLRILGNVLCAQGDYEEAFTAYKRSLALLEGHDPYETAHTRMQWGLTLCSHAAIPEGRAMLLDAQATFSALGATPDMEAVNRMLALYPVEVNAI